ncbi:hypothetical protein VOLCADRAFT_87670 [Volvox carteri f. nagariensis]|uniref:Uncharacterized protein n=1 Tax=Volvox carteri f. nagariensis TaxID=3068 RepID=D8TLY2_VOLCA|nr:uncharacterized protein VOLCADRAFT_87670 [Volvox carteri f. nagariensis]EFJ51413.1 hypothetical protein VOLCADRAFT_87670 [Volvox carteri f. nagariensis]|eukprot:XP_002947365.1 hypothetical protein VOLCADRAFT_87670 [Volvox carteri f. nagariensis]
MYGAEGVGGLAAGVGAPLVVVMVAVVEALSSVEEGAWAAWDAAGAMPVLVMVKIYHEVEKMAKVAVVVVVKKVDDAVGMVAAVEVLGASVVTGAEKVEPAVETVAWRVSERSLHWLLLPRNQQLWAGLGVVEAGGEVEVAGWVIQLRQEGWVVEGFPRSPLFVA